MTDPTVELLPHQLDLVHQVLDDDQVRRVYLAAPWGMGKSTALVALAVEAFKRDARARILFLGAASAALAQTEARLSGTVPVTRVDRYAFRAMSDYQGATAVWNEPQVYILTLQLARQPDVRASLLAREWDLLICDDVSEIGEDSSNTRLIEELADVSVRAVITRHPPFAENYRKASSKIVQWDKSTAINADGRSIQPPDPVQVSVTYPMGADLYKLRERILLLDQSELGGEEGNLAEALESSPAAAEMLAMELQNRLLNEHDGTIRFQTAGLVLRTIEALHADEKVAALLEYVSQLRPFERDIRICVVTRFVQTAYYLASALNELGPVDLVTASQDPVRSNFGSGPGDVRLLVGTPMRLGLRNDLRGIDILIFYDGGASAAAIKLIEAANPLGRENALTIATLEPTLAGLSPDSAV